MYTQRLIPRPLHEPFEHDTFSHFLLGKGHLFTAVSTCFNWEVNESSGSAKFDKAKQTLTLELPVVPKMPKPEALAAARRLQGLHGNLVEEEKDLEGLEELEDSRANSFFFLNGFCCSN